MVYKRPEEIVFQYNFWDLLGHKDMAVDTDCCTPRDGKIMAVTVIKKLDDEEWGTDIELWHHETSTPDMVRALHILLVSHLWSCAVPCPHISALKALVAAVPDPSTTLEKIPVPISGQPPMDPVY